MFATFVANLTSINILACLHPADRHSQYQTVQPEDFKPALLE